MTTLRPFREHHHLTQKQLAVADEVSTSTVYHIEAGKVQLWPSIVRRLARVLAVALSDIDVPSGVHDGKAHVMVDEALSRACTMQACVTLGHRC